MKKHVRMTAIVLCLVLLVAVLLAGCGAEAPAVTTNATEPSKTTQKVEENWGISFEVKDVTAGGLTLICTQSGDGQHLGELTLDSYMLYSHEADDLVDNKDGFVGNSIRGEAGMITVKRGATELVALDWSEGIGSLSSGKYAMSISVLDVFDKETVQTSTEEKRYLQDYTVEFTIP